MSDVGRAAHLALRMPLLTRVKGRSVSVVAAHNEMIQETGQVAFAKFGHPGTEKNVARLAAQIGQGKTFLILVGKEATSFVGFQTEIISVHRGPPTPRIIEMIPPYYGDLNLTAGLWFELCSPLLRCDLSNFRLVSNQRLLSDVVRECRTTSMFVERIPK